MLTESQKAIKINDIIAKAFTAAKTFKLRPHSYKTKGKKAKSLTNIRPPNPYKPGSTYHTVWSNAFESQLN